MNLDAYCHRIGYVGPREPSFSVLCELVRCQTRAISFENLTVAAGSVPDLSLNALQAKLVGGPRGGYCFELNALLQAALLALGFKVTGHSARVRYRLPAELVTPRAHMMLSVHLPEGRFLVDAGFGGITPTAPLDLAREDVQATPHEPARVLRVDEDYLLQVQVGPEWVDVYRFDLAPQLAPDYEMKNWNTATRPGALFASNLIATRPVEGGRHSLFNRTLTWRGLDGVAERRSLASDAALRDALRTVFGLEVPDAEFSAAAAKASRGQALNPSFS